MTIRRGIGFTRLIFCAIMDTRGTGRELGTYRARGTGDLD